MSTCLSVIRPGDDRKSLIELGGEEAKELDEDMFDVHDDREYCSWPNSARCMGGRVVYAAVEYLSPPEVVDSIQDFWRKVS